jgi:iron complex outermembrane receptor protein
MPPKHPAIATTRPLRAALRILVPLLLLAAAAPARAEAPDLLSLSLEELMRVEVTSVAKAPQRVDHAPAAVHVITREDIRRSGARTVAELLRQVPGMHVARLDGTTWAISTRGFTHRFAGKLLVLVDGRSVYSTLYSGVDWSRQDLVLADIERIEVIRGPGGALWGSNAVNGVVNIITRDAADTVGTHVAMGMGSRERGLAEARQGFAVGDGGHMRLYAKAFDREPFEPALGIDAHDGWRTARGGFRWDRAGDGAVSLQGEAYRGKVEQTGPVASLTPPGITLTPETADVGGAHLLADWRARRGGGEWEVKGYVDHTHRTDLSGAESALTHDLSVQRNLDPIGPHRLSWGGGARRVRNRMTGSFYLSLTPSPQHQWQWDGFVQDRIALRDRVELTLGAKVERMTTGEVAFQPSGRVAWRPTEHHTLWGAVSRAVEVPERMRVAGRFNVFVTPGSPPTVGSYLGDPDAGSPRVVAFEAGYRGLPTERLSLDVAGFFNLYDRLVTIEPEAPFVETSPPPTHLVVPSRFAHRMDGESFGADLAATWQASRRLRLTAGYSWLKVTLHTDPGSGDTATGAQFEGSSPEQQARLAARLDLPHEVEVDASAAFTDELPGVGAPAYLRVDLRLAWEPVPGITLSLVGQNLTDPSHLEWGNPNPDPAATEVPRMVFGRVTWTR